MGFVKAIAKLALLAFLVTAVVASVVATRKANESPDVEVDEWPDVPTNPAV